MNTVIFRTIAPVLTAIMLVFSVFVLLRGHNEPGGGFIGGLIAASAVAIYGIAAGVTEVRAALKVDPVSIAGFGVFIAGCAGLVSLGYQVPFLTGIWTFFEIVDTEVAISTPMVFDIGVYFVVLGTISAVALALEEDEGEH
ncbi:Na(+)/H(+) antiporter subunit B [Mariluticola halotolerans]|uniref:Na(+)/H(+) antiporter subunit B n=1 Tax=Mariluticola halotolerans TaxID=2909283 RepID=UPI0026E3293F|nr:Na(+)/H(+) antiporter subunit B [Mariluticola halotolerans]UJQ95765.1 Na(+)/H(+) antiporter subunit B [Mariluticola halotolerans]